MHFETEFIKLLQQSSNKFGDYLFYIFTQFGTEMFFILAVMLVYWCLDKRQGYCLVSLFMLSQVCVGLIKITVKRTRPYYYDGIKAIMERTDGYSFPSGHSNNITVIGIHASMMSKEKHRDAFVYVLATSILLMLFVMLSRMYLGQHFLTDVLAGAAIGAVVGVAGYKIFKLFGDKEERLIYAVLPCCILLFAVTVIAYYKGTESDSLLRISGIFSAFAIGYLIEKKFVKYDVKANKFWRYIVRYILGAAVVIGVELCYKEFCNVEGIWSLIFGLMENFLIGLWISLVAPVIFKALKI